MTQWRDLGGPAHYAVRVALKDGRLKRQPCEVCGAARAEAHHDDYGKPLEVRWLCHRHHRQHHADEKRWCKDHGFEYQSAAYDTWLDADGFNQEVDP